MTPTPLYDELMRLTDWEPLATWNSNRGHLGMDGKRHPGGEWDLLRQLPLRVRRQLTSAGFMTRTGLAPDVMEATMRRNGCTAPDPIAYWVSLARRALRERRAAATRDRRLRLAQRNGKASYYEYRAAQARAAGFASLWHYRKAKGWT